MVGQVASRVVLMGQGFGGLSMRNMITFLSGWSLGLLKATEFCFGIIHGVVLESLKDIFPEIFAFSVKKAQSKSICVCLNLSHRWNLHLRRPLNDWEILPMSTLLAHLERAHVGRREEPETWVWSLDAQGRFSV